MISLSGCEERICDEPSAFSGVGQLLLISTRMFDVSIPRLRALQDSDICEWFESIFEDYKHRDGTPNVFDISELLSSAQEVQARLRILRIVTSANALRVDFSSEDQLALAANSMFDVLTPYKIPGNPTKGAKLQGSKVQGCSLSEAIDRAPASKLLEYHKAILSQCSNQNISDSLKRWVVMQVFSYLSLYFICGDLLC
jgi:hypothetical protein